MNKLNRYPWGRRLAVAGIAMLATVSIVGCGGERESYVGGSAADPTVDALCEFAYSFEVVGGNNFSGSVGTYVGNPSVRLKCHHPVRGAHQRAPRDD